MEYILTAHNVIFKSIIKYPEIEIQQGKTTFLQGASGCGKSTLLKLFNKTLSPDSGIISYGGKDIETLDTILLRQEVLLAGQSVYLFRGTIKDNFQQYYQYRGLDLPIEDEMKYYLSICCADYSLDAICDTMSGGERQRVYIAICASLMPNVLMLDEATSALDDITANGLLQNMKQFCIEKNITLLAISHDTALAKSYGDQIIYLERQV